MNRLKKFRRATKLLRTLHPQLRVSQVDLLISVALKEGQSQTDLAMDCDLTIAAISRAVDTLGKSGRRDGKGVTLGLVRTERAPDDDRFLLVFLTQRGRDLMQSLADLTYGEGDE